MASLFFVRFGHTATPLSDGGVLLVGGFGLDKGKHMRLDGVQLLHTVQGIEHPARIFKKTSFFVYVSDISVH